MYRAVAMPIPSSAMESNSAVQPDPEASLALAEAACARNDHRSGAALARRVIYRAAAAGDAFSANLAAILRRLGEHEAARARSLDAIDLAQGKGATDHEMTFRLALASFDVEAAPSTAGCSALERQLDDFPADLDSDSPAMNSARR